MNNIKQKFTKFIFSFCCLLIISACESTTSNKVSKKSIHNTSVTEIAILVPLSGEQEEIGKQYANLIKMGLGDGAKSKIRISSYDSSSAEILTESVNKILDKKTDIIIGPIFSKDTKHVANMIKDRNIILLSLSNDPTLAESNIFVFGHAPMRQMEQMTNYLLKNEYKNFVTLFPSNKYSQTISKIIENMIIVNGAVLNKMEFYSPNEDAITKAVNVVSDNVDQLNEQEENLKQPVVLISDEADNLKKIYHIAKSLNLDKKAVIAGDNRLDVEGLDPFDLIFTGSIKMLDNNLKNRATKLGINHISFMHILAYDAGKMIASYIGQNYNKESFLAKFLSKEIFPGISGNITFIDSIAQRQYDIIKKHNGQYNIVKNEELGELTHSEKVIETDNLKNK